MDTLFDEPSSFDRDELAARLKALASRHIYIGGSSWKYEGWLGQIYSRSRYLSRGRFSQKAFNDTCLQEYAQTFPTVCGDFAFYQFPTRRILAPLIRADAARFPFCIQSARANYLQSVSGARALRRTRGKRK